MHNLTHAACYFKDRHKLVFFRIYLFFHTQFLLEFIYSICNHKINANINKNKGTQVIDIKFPKKKVIDIKSHFINIMIHLFNTRL